MKVRSSAWFATDIPDDTVEDDDDILVFGGRNVAEALAVILQGLGCQIEDIEYLDFKGWSLNFRSGELGLECRVQHFDDGCLINIFVPGHIPKELRAPWPAYFDVLMRLSAAMHRDQRFQKLRWQEDGNPDWDEPGDKDPVTY